jgi:hypothetical protein
MVYWIIPSATQACIAFILSYNHTEWGPSTRKNECTLPAEIVPYTSQCKYLSNPFTKGQKYPMFTFNDLPARNAKVMAVSKIMVYKKILHFTPA